MPSLYPFIFSFSLTTFVIYRYLVADSSLPVQQTAALGAKLVRRLIADEDTLFLSRPLTWND